MISLENRQKYGIDATTDGYPQLELALFEAKEKLGWKGLTCHLVKWCNENQPSNNAYKLLFWLEQNQSIPVKRRVIYQCIAVIESELKELTAIRQATPLTEILKIRQEAQQLFEQNPSVEQRISEDFVAKIEELQRRESAQFALAEKGKDSLELINKETRLQLELIELKNELYRLRS